MTLREYATKHARLARKFGLSTAVRSAGSEGVAKAILRPYARARQRRLRQRVPAQQTLLNKLWERDQWTLVVFDAGRYDYLWPIMADLFRGDVQEVYSAARDTFEWISQVWLGDHQDVTYVSGMVPVTERRDTISHEDFRWRYDGINPGDSIGEIVSLWETEWDNYLSTVPPERLTDCAMEYADAQKLVVHYNQPHSPYVGTPKLLGHSDNRSAKPNTGQPNDQPIWERVRDGEISDHELRMAYIGNAARVLRAVKPLVQARENVFLTADHGEALGEWGMYIHDRAPHPKRRSVPWMEVTGIPGGRETTVSMDTEEKLAALGYR